VIEVATGVLHTWTLHQTNARGTVDITMVKE